MRTMWLPAYATRSERLCRLAVVTFAFAVLVFLIGPLFVVFPLSVSKDPFFTFPIQEYSWRWYADFFGNSRWTQSLLNSLVAALFSTALATLLGTLAALGISRPGLEYQARCQRGNGGHQPHTGAKTLRVLPHERDDKP